MKTLKYLIVLSVLSLISCLNYDLSKVQFFEQKIDSYFGYSVLLQKGDSPFVIVGAPKSSKTGSVYRCSLKENRCHKFNIKTNNAIIHGSGNGDFLGASLDGDDVAGGLVITCAPHYTTQYDALNYFTNGVCFKIGNSSKLFDRVYEFSPLKSHKQINTIDRGFNTITYYNSAFGQSGFDLEYCKDTQEILIGAPGMTQGNGAIVRYNLYFGEHDVLPMLTTPPSVINNYFGYSVTYGIFVSHSNVMWYVVGAPRAAQLKGQVVLFERTTNKEHYLVHGEFVGEELGAYFGASVLVIGETVKHLMVGAPMAAGDTWDEGCVYFYRNRKDGSFELPIKLVGAMKIGARFGTTMANLGDIDLDSFNDAVIGAPNEDDGIGAVYIYLGNKNGFNSAYRQRISPSQFEINLPKIVRGFGLGLSRGNDFDNNGHNDVAVGAYKSNQVFIIKALPVIDYKLAIKPSQSTLNITASKLIIDFCIGIYGRNGKNATVHTKCQILLDNRAIYIKNITEDYYIEIGETICVEKNISFQGSITNIDPFVTTLVCNVAQDDFISSKSDNSVTENIPFSIGCGNDSICQPNLSLEAETNLPSVVLGLDKTLEINVIIDNIGDEPAYQTKLYLTIPENVNLINLRECNLNNATYVCPIDEILIERKHKLFQLDISATTDTFFHYTLEVKSLGIDLNLTDNKINRKIPITLLNNPFMESKSEPDSILLTKMPEINHQLIISHQYIVGNLGPSPIDLNLEILIPKVNYSNKQVIKIESLKGDIFGVEVECDANNRSQDSSFNTANNITNIAQNRTIFVDCSTGYWNFVCKGGYLFKSSKTAIFSVKISIQTDLIAKNYQEELMKKDIVAVTSSAILNNGTKSIQIFCYTPLYGLFNKQAIPFSIYILALTLGLLSLLLLVVVLYKCNFFKRNYKEIMENENVFLEENENDNTVN